MSYQTDIDIIVISYQTDSILYFKYHSIILDICSDVKVFFILSSKENNGTEVTLWIQMELILD